MKLLKRNTTEFQYLGYNGKTEVLSDGRHTGRYMVTYADPVPYRGTIDLPSGFASRELFGIDTQYTHVLVMDRRDADIRETGRIVWDGNTYEITAVRRSLNFLSAALKKLPSPETPTVTPASATPVQETQTEEPGEGE